MNSQPVFQQEFNIPNNYYYFNNVFTNEEIHTIVDSLENKDLSEAGIGIDSNPSSSIRRSKIAFIPFNKEWEWAYDRLINLVDIANKEMWKFNLVSAPEMIQYTTYHGNEEGHYGAHMDCGTGLASLRKVSITVQLSEPTDYEGGNLQLLKANEQWIDAPREKGGAVIFPSFLYHKVVPVTSGIRRSLVLWVGGEHYK